MPGFFGYEAGQCCVGDHFAWFVEHAVPERYHAEARERGIDIHVLLQEQAAALAPGRVRPAGARLVERQPQRAGRRRARRPAGRGHARDHGARDLPRRSIEATAFGTRVIIEALEANGVPVNEIVACGGLAEKSPLIMQIYADVTGKTVQAPGLRPDAGARLRDVRGRRRRARRRAATRRSRTRAGRWPALGSRLRADPGQRAVYDALYREYVRLHDYFGRGENDVMKTLRGLRARAKAEVA